MSMVDEYLSPSNTAGSVGSDKEMPRTRSNICNNRSRIEPSPAERRGTLRRSLPCAEEVAPSNQPKTKTLQVVIQLKQCLTRRTRRHVE